MRGRLQSTLNKKEMFKKPRGMDTSQAPGQLRPFLLSSLAGPLSGEAGFRDEVPLSSFGDSSLLLSACRVA